MSEGVRMIDKALRSVALRPREEWTLEDCVRAADYLMRYYEGQVRNATPEDHTANLWFALSALRDISSRAAELGGDLLTTDAWRKLLADFLAPENRRDTSGMRH